jgi:hypothetical protein
VATRALRVRYLVQVAILAEMFLVTSAAAFLRKDFRLGLAAKVVDYMFVPFLMARTVARVVIDFDDVGMGTPQRIRTDGCVGDMAFFAIGLTEMRMRFR